MYKELDIGVTLPEDLQQEIDNLLNDLNNNDGRNEDIYRTEIECILKWCDKELTKEQIRKLKDYYVIGEIFHTGRD